MSKPFLRRELAKMAVENKGVSIALACRAFDISESCYRYEPLLSDENAFIADWLTSLTDARKNWGFGLCFLYLRNVKGCRWNLSRRTVAPVEPRKSPKMSGCGEFTANWN